MGTWKPIVGLSFDAASFDIYCKGLSWPSWRPSFIVLHNTSVPNLAQRPQGFTKQHIQNLVGYYRDQQHWTAGPHLFIDDHQIWVFTPLNTTGRHSPAWNMVSLGIEMLGEYETDAFDTGRGLAVQKNAVAAMASLSSALGLDPKTIKLHKEDPVTTHKTCPGRHVDKAKIIAGVSALLSARYNVGHAATDGHPD